MVAVQMSLLRVRQGIENTRHSVLRTTVRQDGKPLHWYRVRRTPVGTTPRRVQKRTRLGSYHQQPHLDSNNSFLVQGNFVRRTTVLQAGTFLYPQWNCPTPCIWMSKIGQIIFLLANGLLPNCNLCLLQ